MVADSVRSTTLKHDSRDLIRWTRLGRVLPIVAAIAAILSILCCIVVVVTSNLQFTYV